MGALTVASDNNASSAVYRDCFSQAERLIRDEGCARALRHNEQVFDQVEGLAARLLVHSVNEAVGAAVLGRVAKHHSGSGDSRLLTRHARDEARHSKLLAQASAAMLPGLSARRSHVRARAAAEIGGYDGQLMNFYCATHVAEIRNLFVLDQYVGLVRAREQLAQFALEPLFLSILADEQRHVDYTRRIIEPWLESSPRSVATFIRYAEIHKELVLDPVREMQE
jgi:hypothetical protein